MSISPVIDEHYRLQPSDLGRSSVQVTIQNISWQGIEQLHLLLHLREFPQKRLLLQAQQVQRLIEIAGSIQERDWIGHTLFLWVEYEDGEPIITLHPFTVHLERAIPLLPRPQRQQNGRTLLLFLLLALIFTLVFLLENSDTLWQLF